MDTSRQTILGTRFDKRGRSGVEKVEGKARLSERFPSEIPVECRVCLECYFGLVTAKCEDRSIWFLHPC